MAPFTQAVHAASSYFHGKPMKARRNGCSLTSGRSQRVLWVNSRQMSSFRNAGVRLARVILASAAVQTWRGVDVFTWMKHEGAWRIVALAYADEAGQTRGAP